MKLYNTFISSASYRVRIALNLKSIAYEYVSVNPLKGDNLKPEYLSVNPQGLIPTLVDGENRLTQSLAIIEYLEETHPEMPLLPADPLERARVRAHAHAHVLGGGACITTITLASQNISAHIPLWKIAGLPLVRTLLSRNSHW